jgi:hypothetical protein
MKQLEKKFSRKKIIYDTIKRTEKVGLSKLYYETEHVGWEVSRIHQNKAYVIAGREVEAGESIVGDERFGYDGSKAFFPFQETDASDYFYEFMKEVYFKELSKQSNLSKGLSN